MIFPNAVSLKATFWILINLKEAVTGQDIVYANLAGDLEAMAKNIVKAMEETGVKKLIFISSIGIYDVPLKPVLKPYRKAVDVIEAIRP
jgi:nucleoside-diphosphate-sugar epimerase